ncbi:MtrAB system accessory lipoprotein LpqB [Nocardioides marmoribigeumensis]
MVAVVLAAALLAACSQVPSDGPVRSTGSSVPSPSSAPFDFNPPGPRAGAGPAEIVTGFLTALEATPVSTRVASQYLTERAASAWRPQRRTLLYQGRDVQADPVQDSSSRTSVALRLTSPYALDGGGRWDGPARDVDADGLTLELVRDRGQWRLSSVPDAMVVPLSYFQDHYARYDLHFFDPSGRLLVPEPVYLPRGPQAATLLVDHLLDGPRRPDRGVERTYFPPRTRLAVSVPIRSDGVAEVPLSEEVDELEGADLDRALAQLVWTLRQLPDVTAVRVTAGGRPLRLTGTGPMLDVDSAASYSPFVSYAEDALFSLDGDTVQEIRPFTRPARTPLVKLPVALPGARLGVSLQATAAAVSDDDGLVRTYPAGSGVDSPAGAGGAITAGGSLRPLWDWSRRVWLVDPAGGPEAVRVSVGSRQTVLPVAGLPAGPLTAAALSRDGTRLVLALAPAGGRGARLYLTRVLRASDESGTPVRLSRARPIATQSPLKRVVDVAWRDGTQVAVLSRTSRTTSLVDLVSVDGESESGALSEPVDVLFDRAVSLTSSPGTRTLLVTTLGRRTFELSLQGRWVEDADLRDVARPVFVG